MYTLYTLLYRPVYLVMELCCTSYVHVYVYRYYGSTWWQMSCAYAYIHTMAHNVNNEIWSVINKCLFSKLFRGRMNAYGNMHYIHPNLMTSFTGPGEKSGSSAFKSPFNFFSLGTVQD